MTASLFGLLLSAILATAGSSLFLDSWHFKLLLYSFVSPANLQIWHSSNSGDRKDSRKKKTRWPVQSSPSNLSTDVSAPLSGSWWRMNESLLGLWWVSMTMLVSMVQFIWWWKMFGLGKVLSLRYIPSPFRHGFERCQGIVSLVP